MARRIIIGGKTGKFNTSDWVDSDTGIIDVKAKKIKKDSFLDECAGYTSDEYWRNLIINMSIGINPEGLTYANGRLTAAGCKQAINIDPEIACDEIICFLKTYLHLRSPDDQEDEEEIEEIKDESGELWSKMLKKHKEQAIIRFLLNEQRTKKLTPSECERLHCILNLGFALKYFHKDNVSVSNFAIVSIDALIYNPETKSYSIDRSQKKKESRSASRSNVKPKKNYNDIWRTICNKVVEDKLELEDEEAEEDEDDYSRSTN